MLDTVAKHLDKLVPAPYRAIVEYPNMPAAEFDGEKLNDLLRALLKDVRVSSVAVTGERDERGRPVIAIESEFLTGRFSPARILNVAADIQTLTQRAMDLESAEFFARDAARRERESRQRAADVAVDESRRRAAEEEAKRHVHDGWYAAVFSGACYGGPRGPWPTMADAEAAVARYAARRGAEFGSEEAASNLRIAGPYPTRERARQASICDLL